MLSGRRQLSRADIEDFFPNEDRLLREELTISSPCPPPHMVLQHAAWLRAWNSRCVGHSHTQCRPERLSPGTKAVIAAAKNISEVAAKLPVWPSRQTAAIRRSKMAAEIISATEDYDGTTGLLLIGKTGAGKTVGAVHTAFSLWERCFRERVAVPFILFVKATDLAAARRCHALGEGEPELVLEATEAPLLLLDDLGQDDKRDNTVFEVLDARYDAQRPTVVTSGFPVEEISARYGQALVRRIVETNGAGKIVNLLKPVLRAAK